MPDATGWFLNATQVGDKAETPSVEYPEIVTSLWSNSPIKTEINIWSIRYVWANPNKSGCLDPKLKYDLLFPSHIG